MGTITNKGKETATRMVANVSPAAPFTYMAIGTGSAAESASDTALGTENILYGAERAAATCSFTAPGTITWQHLFSFSDNVIIRELGIFNDPTAGDMFLRILLANNKNYEEGFSALITINTTITANV
jgi:hypothetical protein